MNQSTLPRTIDNVIIPNADLVALTAVVAVLILVLPPLAQALREFTSNANTICKFYSNPNNPTTLPLSETFPSKEEFLPNLIEYELPEITDKVETLLDLWKKIYNNNISISEGLFKSLKEITEAFEQIPVRMGIIDEYFEDVIELSADQFMDYYDYMNWLNITKELSEQLLTHYHIFSAFGLIG